jgi:hypothetical protein
MPRERTWGTPAGRSRQYFRPRPPYTLLVLALTAGALVLGGLLLSDVAGRWVPLFRAPLMPGALVARHSGIVNCDACHVPLTGVSNFRCQRCHDEAGPGRLTQVAHAGRHYGRLLASKDPYAFEQVQNLPCAQCHIEHRGRGAALSKLPPGRCEACHARKRSDADGPRPRIADFQDHVEFGILAAALRNKTQPEHETGIFFSHAEHMVDVTKDLKKRKVPIRSARTVCEECHVLDLGAPEGHRDFQPITAAGQCLRCHTADLKADPVALQDLVAMDSLDPPACGSPGIQCNGAQVTLIGVSHRDPFILRNVRALRRELYPAEHVRESQELLLLVARLERRILLSEPVASLTADALGDRMTTFRGELALIAERLKQQEGVAPVDPRARLAEVLAAAQEGGDPGLETLERLLRAPQTPRSTVDFERERDALLRLLDAIAAAEGVPPSTKQRAAFLRLRLLSIEPGEPPSAGLERARRDRQESLDRLEDEQRLRRSGLPPAELASSLPRLQAALTEATARLRELRELDALGEARPEDRPRKERALRAVLGERDQSGCLKCHDVRDGTFLPVTASHPVLTLAVFTHEAHLVATPPERSFLARLMSPAPPPPGESVCDRCHGDVSQSKKSTDLHLLSITSCRECHNPRGQTQDCELCHRYHPPLSL